MERKNEALTQNLYNNLTLILLLRQILKEDLRPMPKPGMPIMDTIQHGTPAMPIHTMGATTMERKREVLTQNLHRNQIQKEGLKPMPKPGMHITDTTQHGTPDITIHTGAITTMERRKEVLTQNLYQNQIQREGLKLMPKPGTPIMDTIPHGIPQDTMVTTHTTIMESNT